MITSIHVHVVALLLECYNDQFKLILNYCYNNYGRQWTRVVLGLVGMEVCGECWISLGQRDKFGSLSWCLLCLLL